MKRKKEELDREDYIKTLDYLYTAAASVRGKDKVKAFLKDLLTPSEKIMLGRRIWIARLLLAEHSQREISERLKVGPNTVWKVKKWLEDQFPGYEKAIQGIEKEMDARAIRREASKEPFSFAALKRKYPLHFMFFSAKPKKQYRQNALD